MSDRDVHARAAASWLGVSYEHLDGLGLSAFLRAERNARKLLRRIYMTEQDAAAEYEVGYRVSPPTDAEPGVGVELIYPRLDGHPSYVEVDLEDVRATDPIRITYDFDRDGWAIQQAKTSEVATDHPRVFQGVQDWHEVAFVKSWGLDDG